MWGFLRILCLASSLRISLSLSLSLSFSPISLTVSVSCLFCLWKILRCANNKRNLFWIAYHAYKRRLFKFDTLLSATGSIYNLEFLRLPTLVIVLFCFLIINIGVSVICDEPEPDKPESHEYGAVGKWRPQEGNRTATDFVFQPAICLLALVYSTAAILRSLWKPVGP